MSGECNCAENLSPEDILSVLADGLGYDLVKREEKRTPTDYDKKLEADAKISEEFRNMHEKTPLDDKIMMLIDKRILILGIKNKRKSIIDSELNKLTMKAEQLRGSMYEVFSNSMSPLKELTYKGINHNFTVLTPKITEELHVLEIEERKLVSMIEEDIKKKLGIKELKHREYNSGLHRLLMEGVE